MLFKGIYPIINAGKDIIGIRFTKEGTIEKITIKKEGIILTMSGLPDIFLRADS